MESTVKMHQECKKCKTEFSFTSEDTWWDEKGFSYSTKLTRCPECGCINVVKHVEDYGADVNVDERFYTYNKKHRN